MQATMPDSTVRAAKIAALKSLFDASGFAMPETYRAILGHPEWLPSCTALITEPSRVILLNLNLRSRGWFTSRRWPKEFLAIGEQDDNVVFFDASTDTETVWFADHESSSAASTPRKCVGMAKLAETFADYFAICWRDFLQSQAELPTDSQGDDLEFALLRDNPHPLLLETYFEDSAIPYAAYQAWTLEFGDYNLFFSIINLPENAARELIEPAVRLASRQTTYGRLRAALCLIYRLIEKLRLTRFPRQVEPMISAIAKQVAKLELEDYEYWVKIEQIRKKT